ncbi:MAG TPA: non-canonical purine NTP pyrophosphatase [Syntrophaceae bacterium]|jgi:XTP/dITP diphosphohydrolase|nr:XTP/dITP diphosphatase [Smithellaceae bacterium]HCS77731.1 non-canonical purine NTP pyrophosphatase [Syntrophaceae bacterium]HCX01228.1 non-canonical purine NTP pyrophosphatase [Syntrophaceae bacterium]
MRIVFATKNEGKVREITEMIDRTDIELVSLNHFAALPEIVEDGATYLENALKKARIVSEFTGETVLADDSGLQVNVLKGEPGVYSARYAGEGATDEENNAKLLARLKNIPEDKRTASFFCALVLYDRDGRYASFEAEWRGRIIDEGRGTNGFGYDPIFLDPKFNKTAAELPPDIKNKVSHRGQAFAKLKACLDAGGLG